MLGELFPDRDYMLKRYPGVDTKRSYCLRAWDALRAAMWVIVELLRVSKFNKILSNSILTKEKAMPPFSKGGLGGILEDQQL